MKKIMLATIVSSLAGLASAEASIPSGGYGKPTDCLVDSFVSTRWGQTTDTGYADGNRCYNYYITYQGNKTNDYAGCVAVAIGQVMRHWAWDGSSTSPFSTNCYITTDGKTVTTNRQSTLGGPYDWANMPFSTTDGATEQQRQAIGKLIHDIAVSSCSTFTPTGTFTIVTTARKRLSGEPFRYASAEDVCFNDQNCPYSEDLLKKMIVPNLDIGAPVILAVRIDDSLIEHEIVVDGYGYDVEGRLLLHSNIGGWGGGDGWFRADEGFLVGEHEYTTINECIFNVFPTNTGSVASGRILDASRRAVVGATVNVYSNDTLVSTTLSGANGVYGFILAPGNYTVRASNDGFSAETPISVGKTESRQFIGVTEDGKYWGEPEYAPVIGNSYGNDILLPGAYSEQAAEPTVSPNGGDIDGATPVSIASTTPGAIIRYTLDGSDPTAQSPIYTNSISISDSVTLKAIAFARNMNPSIMTSANFTYKNSSVMVGDDRSAPMMLAGTNVTRKVDNYYYYTHIDYDQPNADPEIDTYVIPPYIYSMRDETRSAWISWTAPGNGTVSLTAKLEGDDEYGWKYSFTDGSWGDPDWFHPYFGTIMGVYCDGTEITTAPSKITLETVEGETRFRIDYNDSACCQFTAEQGKTYQILCKCPVDLDEYYGDLETFYHEDENGNWVYGYFDYKNSYLSLSLSANLTTTPPAATKMTVPTMANATVAVTADGVTVRSQPGDVELADNVNYAITYTADSGYQFSDGKSTWSAIVRDDTGADFSVAELDGYPEDGPEAIAWHRPSSDGESVTRALIADGFGGAVTQEVTTVAAFDAFIGYLGTTTGAADENELTAGEKTNAYLCYRLASAGVPEVALAPKDVTITDAVAGTDGSLAIELTITGVTAGESVTKETLKAVVRAYGGTSPKSLSRDNVNLSGVGVSDGRVLVNVAPAESLGANPQSFFTRLEVIK